MKNLKLNSLLILLAGMTISCSDNPKFETNRWSRLESASSDSSGLDSQNLNLRLGKKEFKFEQQAINGVEVEDSFDKKIFDDELVFASSNWIRNIPIKLRLEILFMKFQAKFIAKRVQNKFSQIKLKNLYEEPKLIIQDGEVRWKLVLNLPSGELKGFFLDSNLEIKKTTILGSRFEGPEATIFPEGPLKSNLQNVILNELAENKTLNTLALKVSTQSNEKAIAENSQFKFSIEDQRFAQVQVFYYLSKTLNWVQEQFQYRIPFQLEAETFVGFPEKTNTAFYYQRKIRLGQGDGVVFSNIPLDPSLVIHESFHSVVDAVARLPFQGEGGSLNEGLSDFFAAMLLGNPLLGEVAYKKAPYKRSVQNSLKLQDANGGLYRDSEIISGLLWSLSQRLGKQAGLNIAWEVLTRLNPTSKISDFEVEIKEVIGQLSQDQQRVARNILEQRGWGQ